MKLKNYMIIMGFAVIIASIVVTYYIFTFAYINGIVIGKRETLTHIDTFHEADVKLILLIIGIPCIIYFFKDYFRMLEKEMR